MTHQEKDPDEAVERFFAKTYKKSKSAAGRAASVAGRGLHSAYSASNVGRDLRKLGGSLMTLLPDCLFVLSVALST